MSSNRRGNYAEKDLAKRLPEGRKVSERGKPGHDVESAPVNLSRPIVRWEAKYMKALPGWLRSWLQQAEEESAALAFKENYGRWYVVVPLDHFEETVIDPAELVQLTAEEVSGLRVQLGRLLAALAGAPASDLHQE